MEYFDVNVQANINGVITALATPYKNGKIDEKSFVKLLTIQKKAGIKTVVVSGTTGEHNFLSVEENRLLLSLANHVFSAETVVAGIGGSTTENAVKQAVFAKQNGAKALLVAPPPFSKCTPGGFVKHVAKIEKNSLLPLVLYNVPSRSGYVLPLSAVKKCLRHGVVALKDAGTNSDYTKKANRFVNVLCGSDNRLLAENFASVVSVTSNVAPLLTQKVLLKRASTPEQNAFRSLCDYCFCEVSPVPIKYLLCETGVFDDFSMRLPLTKATTATRKKAEKLLADYGELLK